jgi:hypothetical protein
MLSLPRPCSLPVAAMTFDWSPHETSTHQDHVIAHVIGATVLGYFNTEQAIHLLLDIGFIWTIYVDGEMGLLPQSLAINELEVDADVRARLREETDSLQGQGGAADGLVEFKASPAGCLIVEVSLLARDQERRIFIRGEESSIAIETSLATGEARVRAVS